MMIVIVVVIILLLLLLRVIIVFVIDVVDPSSGNECQARVPKMPPQWGTGEAVTHTHTHTYTHTHTHKIHTRPTCVHTFFLLYEMK